MEKIKSTSLDLEKLNIEKIKEMFPSCVTEGKINFDTLRELLGDEVDDRKEKFQFSWNGKRESIKLAQTPSTSTLIPCKEKSQNFDKSENLYIEGDNLEVLKQLQKTYFGKIKMIYIDPPYNTGVNLIYKNNFYSTVEDYLGFDEEDLSNNKIHMSNPETNGRFHSDWDSMINARLLLARNLLTDDGIIVLAIDDNELASLIQVCDEVFGEYNRLGVVTVVHKPEGRNQEKFFATSNEYMLFYAKNKSLCNFEPAIFDEETIKSFDQKDDKGYYKLISYIAKNHGREGYDKNLRVNNPKNFYPIYVSPDCKEITLENKAGYLVALPITSTQERTWRYIIPSFEEKLANNEFVAKIEDGVAKIYEKYRIEKGQLIKTHWIDKRYNAMVYGTKVLDDLMGFKTFDFPKSVYLLEDVLKITTKKDSIVLDFFSGSGTTAHAVMNLNSIDNGKRKFIMVQLPEKLEESSDAYKHGLKTLCDIGEERIRKSGEQVKKQWEIKNKGKGLLADDSKDFPYDVGFKVFRLDSTNIKPWDNSDVLTEDQLSLDYNEVFKEDRTKEDILYEIMLKYGIFDMNATQVDINGKSMFRVGSRYMIVCLEDNITVEDIKAICEEKPRVVVFKEDGFTNDNDKINAVYNLEKAGVEDVRCI